MCNNLYYELNRLVDDYFKCDNLIIKKQILQDINHITRALFLVDQLKKEIVFKIPS